MKYFLQLEHRIELLAYSVKSVTLYQNACSIYDMCDLFLSFSVIAYLMLLYFVVTLMTSVLHNRI